MSEKKVYVCDCCKVQIDESSKYIRIPCTSKESFVVQYGVYNGNKYLVCKYETLHFCNTSCLKEYLDKAISDYK